MKYPLFATLLLLVACTKTQQPAVVDLEQAKADVTALIDRFHATMMAKDATGLMALLAEDGLYCGTDPSELWDKKTFSDYITKSFTDTTWTMKAYTIAQREVRVAADGNSATVLDQFLMQEISATIPARLTAHAVKGNDQWMFGFFSLSMVPKNEDLKKVSEAVQL
jgi:hypothetical protein